MIELCCVERNSRFETKMGRTTVVISQVQMKPRFCRVACWLVLVCVVLSVAPVRAQEAGGTIEGTVTDDSGGAVVNATVTIKNIATGVERTVATNGNGFYVAPNLVPGEYAVRTDLSGFASTVVKEVTLTIGERREINITLKVGRATEEV